MSLKNGEVEKLIGSKKLPKINISKHKLWEDPTPESSTEIKNSSNVTILSIHPDDIVRYKYKDRPENELGNLEEFAKTLKSVGQIQPGLVRLSNKPGPKYELIVGERRWRACKLARLMFQAELVNYTDTEAGLAQAVENKEREDLSDYARGINYAKQIEDGVLTQTDLADKLGTTRQQISRLMSYKEIPQQLIDAISDMSKVSPRTAEEIKFICKKDTEGVNLLLTISKKIRDGIGHNTLRKHYEKLKENRPDDFTNKQVFSKNGRHLFTWTKDGNGNLSMSFPKDIRNILDINKAESIFINSIEDIIKAVLSPQGDNEI